MDHCCLTLLQLPLEDHSREEGGLSSQVTREQQSHCLPRHGVVRGWVIAGYKTVMRIEKCALPCTPRGIIHMLKRAGVPLAGKHAVVIGRSNIVGKPVAMLLLQENCTVTICHSHTQNLKEITRQADILVAAVGKAHFVTADMVKEGAAVIDVGVNRVDGKVTGDVDFEAVAPIAGWISPVPGGVGRMTVSMLMENTLEAACRA